MTTKQVTTSMTFEVTVHLTATETADETGADVSDVELDDINVDGWAHAAWISAIKHMTESTKQGDWTDA